MRPVAWESAKLGQEALCILRVAAFGRILSLKVSVAVLPYAKATKTPFKDFWDFHRAKTGYHKLKPG